MRTIPEYASSVWDPHANKYIFKIEIVQCRVARFTLNQHHASSVEEMLAVPEWPSVQPHWQAAHFIMVYKIINSLMCVKCPDLTLHSSSGRRGHNLKYTRFSAVPTTGQIPSPHVQTMP